MFDFFKKIFKKKIDPLTKNNFYIQVPFRNIDICLDTLEVLIRDIKKGERENVERIKLYEFFSVNGVLIEDYLEKYTKMVYLVEKLNVIVVKNFDNDVNVRSSMIVLRTLKKLESFINMID